MCDHVNDPGGREGAMIVIAPGVHCDPCIAPLVRALNESGLPRVPTKHGPDGVATVASCCGHGKRPGSVMLADGHDLLILDSAESDRIGGLWPGINGEPAAHTVIPSTPAVTMEDAGPEAGHTFEVSVRSRGSSGVLDGPKSDDDWWGEPSVLRVRAWNHNDAVAMAAQVPYPDWDHQHTAAAPPCPTCSSYSMRETTGMVCQTCGRDFLNRTALDWQRAVREANAATPASPPTPKSVIHASPRNGEGFMPCCGRLPLDTPRTDRLTARPEFVTCLAHPEKTTTQSHEEQS